MSLQVIGAGFGRTGTLSLKAALERLGFSPCYHMTEVIAHPEQAGFWDRAARGETMDWKDVFSSYKASVDWPSCAFYKELAAYYPKAKVILSLRDPKSWYKSVSETIMRSMNGPVVLPDGRRMGPPGDFVELLVGEKTFHKDFSEANMIAVYERHNEEVKRTIPPERLLVFEAKQGWEPLCRFLDVPVPSDPYPKSNTTEEFKTRFRAAQQQN
jgi:hypothetical protein